jgi:membrane associated rhomboid family serine protease
VTYVPADDYGRGARFRFEALSLSARLALGLAAAHVVQLGVYWSVGRDQLGEWLALRGEPFAPWDVFRLASYGLVHSVEDPLHVTFNALFLFLFGGVLEQERGRRAVLWTLIAGVLVGGAAFAALAALRGDPSPVEGASGGVLAVVVAAAVSAPHLPTLLRMPLWGLAAVVVALDLVRFLNSIRSGSHGDRVAYVAHLGGALAGFLLAARGLRGDSVLLRRPVLVERLRVAVRRRRMRRDRLRGERLDRLLAKIHDRGLPSLSWRERRFLRRASRTIQRGGREGHPAGDRRPSRSGTREP